MKILLVEDDQPTSEMLSAFLSDHRYAVDAIADGLAGLELATQWDYDLILLDFVLPGLSGVEVCRGLRDRGCQTPILMLTVKDADEDVIAGLDAGADDYVAKSCATSQLLARVRALLRRSGNRAATPVLKWENLCLDPATARVTYQQQEIVLRSKEYALLELFLRHPQRILSRSAIIDHLWSMEEIPVEGTVTNLIKDLRQRLKSAGMQQDLIETVYGLGYRLKSEAAQGQRKQQQEDSNIDRQSTLWVKQTAEPNAEDGRSQRGLTMIQRITDRFQASVESRMGVLEAAERSLWIGNLSQEQRTVTRKEVHKLAGGLGTFGCAKASKVAQALEDLLDHDEAQASQLAEQFSQLLQELKQELVESK